MHHCRMTLHSTSTTSGTLSKCTLSSKVHRSHEEKASERTGSQCSSQPWTRCMLDKIGRSWIRSGQTQNRTVWTYLESSPQYSLLVHFEACSERGMQFYQIRSHAVTLSSTLPAICIENVDKRDVIDWDNERGFCCGKSMKTVAGMTAIRESCLTETCEQNTHSYSTHSVAQCVSTSHCRVSSLYHANMRVSSSICVPKTFCHPRIVSRSLPHLTLTTSTNSLSPTSPILQSSSSTHPSLLSHDSHTHCDDWQRSCSSSDLQSPTGYEPKRIELDKNLEVEHQDQTRDRIMGDDNQSPITEEMVNLENTQLTIQQKALLTRNSKTNNYVRCWLHRCTFRNEKETLILLENTVSGNLMQWLYRREKQVHNEHKLITQDERERESSFISRAQSFRETWCNVFIWPWTDSKHVLCKRPRQRIGKPVRE